MGLIVAGQTKEGSSFTTQQAVLQGYLMSLLAYVPPVQYTHNSHSRTEAELLFYWKEGSDLAFPQCVCSFISACSSASHA